LTTVTDQIGITDSRAKRLQLENIDITNAILHSIEFAFLFY